MARGLYGLPGAEISAHRTLAEVSARVPKGVVCLLSALRVHEIGTQAPSEVWIAIPQHMVTPLVPWQTHGKIVPTTLRSR